MEHVDADADQELLDRLAEDFATRCRSGPAPTIAEYARRYPKLASQLQEVLPPIPLLEQLKRKRAAVAEQSAPPPERIGDYRILREVGRGGMGVVYEARQESLARPVALKVLPKHSLLDPKRLARFRVEAQAAARLHHSNIVPVFGLFESDGLFYYAMQLIDGQGLNELVPTLKESQAQRPTRRDRSPTKRPPGGGAKTARGKRAAGGGDAHDKFRDQPTRAFNALNAAPDTVPSSVPRPAEFVVTAEGGRGQMPTNLGPTLLRTVWEQIAAIGVQVADALAYAHDQGILHRDIKPANLLLDGAGTVWVTDFGLAKVLEETDLTSTGDVIGTLQYMAPESLQGRSDARSDVYSLGLTLHELLTCESPWSETNPVKLLQLVSQHEPVRPRRRNPDIPRDLETIVLKATHREPEKRYSSARALAADLRRYLEDRPIKARRVGVAERLVRWSRRNRLLSAAGAVALASLLLAGAALGVAYVSASKALQSETARLEVARAAKTDADAARREAEANMQLSFGALQKTFLALAEHQTTRSGDRPGPPPSPDAGPPPGGHGPPSGPKTAAMPAAIEAQADQFDAKLLATMLEFYDDAAKRKAPSPDLKEQAAKAFTHLGDVYGRMGKLAEATEAYRHATDVYATIREANPKEPRFTVSAAEVAMKWSGLPSEPGAPNDSLALAEQADRWAAELRQSLPLSRECRDLRARTQWTLGRALVAKHEIAAAEPRYREAVDLQQQSVNENIGPPPKFENLLAMQSEYANLLVQAHQPDAAIDVIKTSAAAMKSAKLAPETDAILIRQYDAYAMLLADLGDEGGAKAMEGAGNALERLQPGRPRHDDRPEPRDHRSRPRDDREFTDSDGGRRPPYEHGPEGRGPGERGPRGHGPGEHGPGDHGPDDRGPPDERRGPGGPERRRPDSLASESGEMPAGHAPPGDSPSEPAAKGEPKPSVAGLAGPATGDQDPSMTSDRGGAESAPTAKSSAATAAGSGEKPLGKALTADEKAAAKQRAARERKALVQKKAAARLSGGGSEPDKVGAPPDFGGASGPGAPGFGPPNDPLGLGPGGPGRPPAGPGMGGPGAFGPGGPPGQGGPPGLGDPNFMRPNGPGGPGDPNMGPGDPDRAAGDRPKKPPPPPRKPAPKNAKNGPPPGGPGEMPEPASP